MTYLNDEQEDFLKEIFNLGVGKSCSIISNFSKNKYEVHINVPKVNNLPVAFATKYLNAYTNFGNVIAITQNFSGDFTGKATIVFTAESSLKILNLIIGANSPIELLSDLEKDSLLEMSNVIINSSLIELSKALEKHFYTELPVLESFSSADELLIHCNENDEVLLLESDFSIREEALSGQINLIIESNELGYLKESISEYIHKLGTKNV